jgi:hypothetical protein
LGGGGGGRRGCHCIADRRQYGTPVGLDNGAADGARAAAGFDEHLAKPAKQADLTRLVGEVARRRTAAHAPSFTLQAEA